MNSLAASVSQLLETPNPLACVDALEAEITKLCARIADDGAIVLQALNAAMDAQERDTESADVTAVTSALEERFAQRRADALTTMAETTLSHGPG